MLDEMAKGDMPNEQQLRTIAAASLEDRKEVWKVGRARRCQSQPKIRPYAPHFARSSKRICGSSEE